MKIKTKVRAGRNCGGGPLPSPDSPILVGGQELDIMKIKTKVRAGRNCGPSTPIRIGGQEIDIGRSRPKSGPVVTVALCPSSSEVHESNQGRSSLKFAPAVTAACPRSPTEVGVVTFEGNLEPVYAAMSRYPARTS